MRKSAHNRYRFPWRPGNRFQLLVDGEQFFPAMLAEIGRAESYIALEMYLLESGTVLTRFIDALLAAAERGVQVFLLLDDFGALRVNKQDRARLEHPNLRLEFYNPLHYGELRLSLFRDHRKLLLVDCRTAFVGGAGLTDQFDPPKHKERRWHETMLRIEGPCVGDWLTLFKDNWPAREEDNPLLERWPTRFVEAPENQLGRVAISQMANYQEIKRSLVKRIRSAEHWVWIATAYFVPSWKIRRALRKAAKRGVDVKLILPGPHTDHPAIRHAGRRFYYSLLRNGVHIYEYQPRFNHAKLYLCDHWCSVGSSNVDRWNLIWNLEGNQEVEDQACANELLQLFERDIKECRHILPEQWRRRPFYIRLQEWFWGRIDLFLNRFSLKRRKRR